MKRILVAGEINVDFVFRDLTAFPAPGNEVLSGGFEQTPGSSSMICAMGLARLGNPVIFAGVAGGDPLGDFCIDAMRSRGIDVSAVTRDASMATGVTASLSTGGDRALVTFVGGIGSLKAEHIDDALLRGADHLHVSSYYLQRGLRSGCPELFARARTAGLTISLDPGFDPEQRWDDGIAALLDTVDVFLPNERELLAITGSDDVSSALASLAGRRAAIVVKCGADGAATWLGGGLLVEPAYTVPVVDTTGAGDSFVAGFLHAYLRGLPPAHCLRWGNACGSLSTRGVGGTPAQPDVAEVAHLLDRAA
ncbi:sugar/nucleoside kinase (ribokinase family) [Luteibacter rhizovicinus]|uniref:Sugar/nucleoside kinase (Ribokinase family) n=1 Tax=Luteibacter rhizovicinus TaxID=242606 RepID=A0A4R3YY06_9GAMM|nr:sugar kinase [Luteibacter rhizovicinus]TCV97466.1 sugar/nucleoside kinase (ribokinase family) [Luteibacter rhizovicinus]